MLVAISTVAVVAVVTVSIAFGPLVAARYVPPAADRLEAGLDARLAEARTAEAAALRT